MLNVTQNGCKVFSLLKNLHRICHCERSVAIYYILDYYDPIGSRNDYVKVLQCRTAQSLRESEANVAIYNILDYYANKLARNDTALSLTQCFSILISCVPLWRRNSLLWLHFDSHQNFACQVVAPFPKNDNRFRGPR